MENSYLALCYPCGRAISYINTEIKIIESTERVQREIVLIYTNSKSFRSVNTNRYKLRHFICAIDNIAQDVCKFS